MVKKEKNMSAIWAGFIAFLMLTSVLGFAILGGDSEQDQNYGKYKFTRTDLGWMTKINDKNVLFNYHPIELENINVSDEIINLIKDTNMFYLTFDPEQGFLEYTDLVRFQLTDYFWNFFNIYVENAVTANSSIYNLQIIDCTNSTSAVPVVFLKQGNETGFYKEDNCIIMQSGDGYGFLRLKDRLVYSILNIIQ